MAPYLKLMVCKKIYFEFLLLIVAIQLTHTAFNVPLTSPKKG